MKRKIPLNFYFKLAFILLVLGGTYFSHRPLIDATVANNDLTALESVNVILQGVLGIPGNTGQEVQQIAPTEAVSFPGNTEPQLISEDIKALPNYQLAQKRAERFNQNFDATSLNTLLVENINAFRRTYGSSEATVADYLAEGTQARAVELANYHYLGSTTVEGQAFYSLFSEIPEPQYRLGENLYELYIAADDIHLETWESSEILADYLYGVFQESLETELYQDYHGIYAWVRAEASDYQIGSASYVRLVVVLLLDTQN